MKNYYKYSLVILFAISLFSCSDDYLDVNPKGQKLESNYYTNQEEAYAALVAAYDPIGWNGNNYVTKELATNAASDDFYAGGAFASDVPDVQAWSNYTLGPATGPQGQLWKRGYAGVFRSNILLQKLPEIDMNQNEIDRYTAEMKFLRAYFYFDLIRLFEKIPLFLEPLQTDEINTVTQVKRETVYTQIEKDLKESIVDLPIELNMSTEAGRATQGAAKALLEKVYLEQEKFNEAVDQFRDVNGTPGGTSKYGYHLLDDFGDLFKNENQFNTESIFEVVHSSASNGTFGCINCSEGNLLNQMSAPRNYSILEEGRGAPNYTAGGWSFNIPTQQLADAFKNVDGTYDGRYKYTLSNIDSLAQLGIVSYFPGYHDSGYFLEKFAGKKDDQSNGGGATELNYPQNFYEIRLADTYLMEAEALVRGGGDKSRAQALFDAVRTRSGNSAIEITFDNIMTERRLEFAGEGQRWFDLVRTGRASEALKFKGYVEGKNDKLPIPLLELTNTALEQDPAY